MKKYVILLGQVDDTSIADNNIGPEVNFNVHQQLFNSREEAEKYLEEVLIPEDKANLEECYGFNTEGYEPTVEIKIENDRDACKRLVVYNKVDATEIKTNIYGTVEVGYQWKE